MWSAKCSATLITTAAVSQADRTATACSESVHCQVSSLEVPKEESRKTLSRNSFHTAEHRWRFCSFGGKPFPNKNPSQLTQLQRHFQHRPYVEVICGAVKSQRTGRGEGQKCLKGAWRPCPHADRRDFPFSWLFDYIQWNTHPLMWWGLSARCGCVRRNEMCICH